MPNSAAAKRGVPAGVLLDTVNGEAARHRPLKEVQRLISRAERPVALAFTQPPKPQNERTLEDQYAMPEGRAATPPPACASAQPAAPPPAGAQAPAVEVE